MQQAGAGGAAETVQERQRSGSCQVGGTAALRTHEAAVVDGGIIGAAAEVVQGDVEEVSQGEKVLERRFTVTVFVALITKGRHSNRFIHLFLSEVT